MESSKIQSNISNDKALIKAIAKNKFYTNEMFENDAKRYINAIKQGRMLCLIPSVSASGMSRVIRFLECSKGKTRYNYLNFYAFFLALGYSESRNKEGFIISGCGMDMVFATNYDIIHKLCRLGFITKKQCEFLAQQTPIKL